MADEILQIDPPENTGSETLQRYKYQAHFAFPYCLRCCTGDEIVSVFVEHFEDVIIQYLDSWHMMQIKTRNPDRASWTLSDVIGTGGGIRSLARTYQVTKSLNVTYGLYLEGSISPNTQLDELTNNSSSLSNAVVARVSKSLDFTTEETLDFLNRLVIHPNCTPRDVIEARNLRLLGRISPSIPAGELETVYKSCIDTIFSAMEGDPVGEKINALLGIDNDGDQISTDIQEKRFTKERLLALLGSVIEGSHPLLTRITDIDKSSPTKLEAKLIAGGAGNDVIEDAKDLRASASIRLAELNSSSLFGEDDQIDDLELRVKTLADSIIQRYSAADYPAKLAWDGVLERLERNSTHIDPNNLFRQDPFLLLGFICALTDECKITWGVPIE